MNKIVKSVAFLSLFSLAACAEIIDEICTPEDFCFECPECPSCPEVPECPTCPSCPECPELPPVEPTPEPTPEPPVVCQDFRDGGWGALWKPHSESTGTPVILLPEYPPMSVLLEPMFFDRNGAAVTCGSDCTIKRSNEHNPNQDGTPRAHWWIKNSATWWKTKAPLTIKWFRDGQLIDCRTVDDPTKRYD